MIFQLYLSNNALFQVFHPKFRCSVFHISTNLSQFPKVIVLAPYNRFEKELWSVQDLSWYLSINFLLRFFLDLLFYSLLDLHPEKRGFVTIRTRYHKRELLSLTTYFNFEAHIKCGLFHQDYTNPQVWGQKSSMTVMLFFPLRIFPLHR